MRKKCIIIGSGLGGLSSGAILAMNGYEVTVLESHSRIGGCLQCFTRGGARYETGMHFIGSASPGQTLHKMMRYLEMDDILLSQLDTSAYDIVYLNGEQFKFANGREPFIEGMSSYFPNQKDNLVEYFNIIEEISAASSLHSLRHAETDNMINVHYQTVSIDNVLNEVIDDSLLREVLVGNLPLYAAQKGNTPFSQHAFIMDFYNQSAYRIVGGSDSIGYSLKKTIEKYGGCVLTDNRITKIICNDYKSTGVEVNHEKILPADIIISSIHPNRTIELIDSKLIRPAFKNRISSIPNTVGGFSVYLKFKPESMPYLNSNFYGYKTRTAWNCEKYTSENWPLGYLFMHFCNQENPKWAQSGVILSYMNMEDVARWKGTKVMHRGEDYETFKQQHAQQLLKLVEKAFPGITDHIENYFTSTPLTYLDYTGTEAGSMYGVVKDIHAGPAYRVPHKTKIPNLYLTGQNINSHGMLGVLVGSIVTCSELLTAEKIYQQISQANNRL